MNCNACMSLSLFSTHKCREKCIEGNCPVCHEALFDSSQPIKVSEGITLVDFVRRGTSVWWWAVALAVGRMYGGLGQTAASPGAVCVQAEQPCSLSRPIMRVVRMPSRRGHNTARATQWKPS